MLNQIVNEFDKLQRFNGMDEVKSDEELSEIDENDENEAEEIDEDDDESDNESSSCIEVSDDEDENMVDGINDNDFEQAYKEVKQYYIYITIACNLIEIMHGLLIHIVH